MKTSIPDCVGFLGVFKAWRPAHSQLCKGCHNAEDGQQRPASGCECFCKSSNLKPAFIVTALAALALLFSACSTTGPDWLAPVETRHAGAQAPTAISRSTPAATQTTLLYPISPDAKSYTIQPGDTLFSVAWRSENQVQDLAHWNNLKAPFLIYPGQHLSLVAPPSPSKPFKPAKPSKPDKPKLAPSAPDTAKKPPQPTPVAKQPATRAGQLRWRWPIKGELASTYKAGDPLRKGIKITGKPGASIRASEDGRVIYSGSGLIGYGLLLIIKHNDTYLSAYGHNRRLLVKKGQKVRKGAKIAELGTTNAGKSQLHFEIRRAGKPVNPLSLLSR